MRAFSPGGEGVASSSHAKTVRRWKAMKGKVLLEVAGFRCWIHGAGFNPIRRWDKGGWEMAYSILFLVIFAVTVNVQPAYAQAGFRMSGMEWGIDRQGSDYNVFDLQRPDPALCQDTCFRDPRCMAWTYVHPNTGQGPRPRCWLKQAIPRRSTKPNCVSGYKFR